MTEAEWLACTDSRPMLDFLRGKASDRKLRLFACACCRRVSYLLTDIHGQGAVFMAEFFADGSASEQERERFHVKAYRAYAALESEQNGGPLKPMREAQMWAYAG